MELHITAQLALKPVSQVIDEHSPSDSYLQRLPLSPRQRKLLSERMHFSPSATSTEEMAALHLALAEIDDASSVSNATNPAYASIANRLQLAYGVPQDVDSLSDSVSGTVLNNPSDNVSNYNGSSGEDNRDSTGLTPEIVTDASGRTRITIALPLKRTPIVARPWGTLNPIVRWIENANRAFDRRPSLKSRRRATAQETAQQTSVEHPVLKEKTHDPRGIWRHNGNLRRLVLVMLMLAQTVVATYFMSTVLPYHGTKPLEMLTLVLFAILFCWVSAGFWTAMAGFLVLMRGTDRYVISREDAAPGPIAGNVRTAIVMPICNEDVNRVFAGLRATYESVLQSGELDRFDFFVLSDSGDPDICTAELDAWVTLCRTLGGFGRIFYRHRRRRVKRKSGNIDDFCRRWGANYDYMIVLDADSVMSGTCLTTLVRLMEANSSAGIIQTAPRAAGRDTLYARIQQFSTRVYGPLFTAGLHYWQLGESHYWGHNAIIRLTPFMKYCALAPLPGEGSLAGEILSHDFVEAALMRRAGWGVWIAYDLAGSFEEMPPNLLDELKRDRRWCQGNLMNFRLFLARGMHGVHRAVFVTGVMAYISAPLWFGFLVLSTALLAMHTLIAPEYFVTPGQLFPVWPEWHPEKALTLFSATATLLFLPKILSVILIWAKGAREFGGVVRLTMGMIIELLFSMMLAPVRMLFHTRFVVGAFLGWAISWKSPPREDTETTWGEAVRRHGWHTALGIAWGAGVFFLEPSFLWWLLPIVGSLVLSIPLSVFSSRVSLGRSFRHAGLFVIPEEVDLPPELAATTAYNEASRRLAGFTEAVVDPIINALVCASVTARPNIPAASVAAHAALIKAALIHGPDSLSSGQKSAVLDNPLMLSQLHLDVWSAPEANRLWMGLTERNVASS
ncbi:glucans biosynthesis glucosyltransferase MdoH [Glaciimonas sp. GNP009]|uniref:glucans biosynthesis glucosyltransferase MdoH n=2 Tax=Glaciimonas TaxID=1229970 RepID=UPI002AB5974F|nr:MULTISPECIES: glucans biosynthesis glucosyltransferase MdoH [unclassified Glaciimonas]MDY7547085.1 glucans biosynthesis glucosyltransferase MdoH [Glaciimonas sp. CA11.2]